MMDLKEFQKEIRRFLPTLDKGILDKNHYINNLLFGPDAYTPGLLQFSDPESFNLSEDQIDKGRIFVESQR